MIISADYVIALAMLLASLALGLLALGLGRRLAPDPQAAEDNPPPEHGSRTGHKTWI